MTKLLLLLIVGLLFEAVGVVYLAKGLKQVGEVQKISVSEVARMFKSGVTNHCILLGVFFEAIYFGMLLVMISKGSVTFIWPLTSLGFLLTALSAKFILHEHVSPLRWFGIVLIVLGAGLVGYSKALEEATPLISAMQSDTGQQ